MHNIFDRFQCNFCTRITTVTLSRRMQNFVVFSWALFKWELSKFWWNFEFDRNPLSETGDWVPLLSLSCSVPNNIHITAGRILSCKSIPRYVTIHNSVNIYMCFNDNGNWATNYEDEFKYFVWYMCVLGRHKDEVICVSCTLLCQRGS